MRKQRPSGVEAFTEQDQPQKQTLELEHILLASFASLDYRATNLLKYS